MPLFKHSSDNCFTYHSQIQIEQTYESRALNSYFMCTIVSESRLQFGRIHFQSSDVRYTGLAAARKAKHRVIFGIQMRVGIVAEHVWRKPVTDRITHPAAVSQRPVLRNGTGTVPLSRLSRHRLWLTDCDSQTVSSQYIPHVHVLIPSAVFLVSSDHCV